MMTVFFSVWLGVCKSQGPCLQHWFVDLDVSIMYSWNLLFLLFVFVDAESQVCESDLSVDTNKETLNLELVTTL